MPAKQLRAARAKPSNPPPGLTEEHHNVLAGLTDPFSEHAANARYPDSGAGKSLTTQSRYLSGLTVNADGNGTIAFNPKANYGRLFYASQVGTVVTWPATWSTDQNSLCTQFGKYYRPTSMGLRIVNTLSATTSAGYLVIAKGGAPIISNDTTIAPSNFTSYDMHPLVHGGEWHVMSKPKSANAYSMKLVTDYSTTVAPADETWETIYVAVFSSTASVNTLLIEVVTNFEYVPQEDTAISQMAIAQPILDVQMQTAVNQLQSAFPASHRGTRSNVETFLKKEGKKALLKHVLPFAVKKATQLLL